MHLPSDTRACCPPLLQVNNWFEGQSELVKRKTVKKPEFLESFFAGA